MSMDHGIGLHSKAEPVSPDLQEIRDTVQMMPQDEVRSEHDLGFMTEVDAEYKGGNLGK